jgi:hypothetical protein
MYTFGPPANIIDNWFNDLLRPGGYLSFAKSANVAALLVEEVM